mmetsp:Transcript_2187/g.3087  ORF Transcript_2187/g.3087 Transcript_2187/m.3087 type:complete len:288 (-) Transcript_2187:339-1202(-)
MKESFTHERSTTNNVVHSSTHQPYEDDAAHTEVRECVFAQEEELVPPIVDESHQSTQRGRHDHKVSVIYYLDQFNLHLGVPRDKLLQVVGPDICVRVHPVLVRQLLIQCLYLWLLAVGGRGDHQEHWSVGERDFVEDVLIAFNVNLHDENRAVHSVVERKCDLLDVRVDLMTHRTPKSHSPRSENDQRPVQPWTIVDVLLIAIWRERNDVVGRLLCLLPQPRQLLHRMLAQLRAHCWYFLFTLCCSFLAPQRRDNLFTILGLLLATKLLTLLFQILLHFIRFILFLF